MARKPSPTIRDVADHAGVSPGTVSAVVNQRSSVRESTRSRVLDSIRELGYRPSRPARQLRMARRGARESLNVGLVIKELRNPFYADIMKGADEVSARRGASLYMASSEGSLERERETIRHLLALGVDALIVAPVLNEDSDLDHLYDLRRAGHPLVLLEQIPWLRTDVVSVDNREMSKRATEHLMLRGHDRILHFAGPPYTAHTKDRIAGFREAFVESSLAFSPDMVVPVGASLQNGFEAGMEYFQSRADRRPTAVTCFNDMVAVGLLRALRELNLDVPSDVAVVGFDGDPMVEFLNVPLTTVAAQNVEMGRLAAERVLDLASSASAEEPRQLTVPAELVIRRSSAGA